MSNFFDQFDGTAQAQNHFDQFDAAVPVEPSEQDVIHRTNNPLVETPSSFGLVDVPTEAVKGFASRAFSAPSVIGGNLIEAGELATGMEGQSTGEVAAKSFAKRMIENIAEGDTGVVGTLQSIWGAEKDALLSLFSDGETPRVMINAGNKLIEQNQSAISSLGLTPKGGSNVSYDIGAGFASLGFSIGSTFITKSPTVAATYMTALVNSGDYMEARKAGKEPEEAATIAASSAYGQGLIEMLGGKVFLHAAAGSTVLRKILMRATGQAVEEGSQAAVEEEIKDVSGVRNKTFEEKALSVAYQAMIGFVVGAPVSAIVTKIEESGRKQGIPDDKIKEISDSLVEHKDEIIDAATVMIDKETAGVTNDEPARAETLKAVKQVFAEQAQIEEAETKGTTDDPNIAAKILLKSPDTNEETKTAIKALGDNFTMEQLQEAIPQSEQDDTALAEALALEQKHSAALQEKLDQWRQMTSPLRESTAFTKRQIRETQETLIDFVNKSGLPAADKAKFMGTLKNIQTAQQLVRHIDEIDHRISGLLDDARRREAVSKIKNTLSKAQQGTVAVDFTQQVEALANKVDTTKRTEATKAALKKTLDYLQKNPGAEIPNNVKKKLEILNKKPIEEVTTEELEAIAGQMDELVKQGKTKLRLMESKKERLKQERLEKLEKDSVPLSDTEVARAPIGERLAAMERIKNRYTEFKNRAGRIGIATNPMDVFFDMLDGGKNYKGANHQIFKQTIDKAYSRYLNLKESATRAIKNLQDKLNLSEQSFEKIGAWAVLQQEGGEKKLLDSGITQEEINGLTLTEPEMQMYKLMRKKLDEMLPAIQGIMRTVYNKEVDGVKDYFPFMTDHDAMRDFEIQDQLGPQVPQIGKKKNVEKGFTESRTLGKQRVRIDAFGVFLKHVDNAAYLIELGQDIKELGEVAADAGYGEAVGDIGQEMVVEWINLLARKGSLPGRIPLIDAFRRNVGLAVLGFKLSSILIQPTSLADGAALVGGGYVAEGVVKMADPEWRQFVWENFPEVRERAGDDPAYLDMGGNGVVGSVRQAGFWALKKVDALAASATAIGAYTKAVEEKGGTVDLDNPDPEAIQEAQLMVRRTQSSPFAKDAPPLLTQGELTGNTSVDKLIFQFQSFMLNRWSLIKHDMWQLGVKNGNTKQALNVATWIMLATAAEIGIRRLAKELIAALTGDELKPWEDTITKEAAMTALGNVPFVSQAVSSFEYGSIPVPSIGMMTQIGDRLKWAAQSKSPEKKAQHYAEAAVLLTGTAFGVPGTLQSEQVIRSSMKKKKKKKSSVSTP